MLLNENNYSTVSAKRQDIKTGDHHHAHYVAVDAVLNKQPLDNENEQNLIMSFDFDGTYKQ